jgi:hypothetical protein
MQDIPHPPLEALDRLEAGATLRKTES